MRLTNGVEAQITFTGKAADRRPREHMATPVRLEDDEHTYTLLMDFIEVHDTRRTALVEFLSPNAPSDHLVQGTLFDVLEGTNIIGHGVIT